MVTNICKEKTLLCLPYLYDLTQPGTGNMSPIEQPHSLFALDSVITQHLYLIKCCDISLIL